MSLHSTHLWSYHTENNMTEYEDDDVEVLYDVPYGNGNVKPNKTKVRPSRSSNGQNRTVGKKVDFATVFDPFERDQDDLREFFDDEDKNDEGNDDWEKPTMFNDPRKVRKLIP